MMWLARQLQHPHCRDHLLLPCRRLLLTSFRLFSPSARCRGTPAPSANPTHFMVDYLVSSCGLSSAEALRASKPLAHLKSPERPDAILRFLRQEGLGDAHIRRAVLRFPRMLLSNTKKTLEPKIRALQGAGLSGSEIGQLVSLSPNAIYLRDVLHRVEFWRKLVGSNQNLLKAMSRDARLLCHDLNDKVIPGLSLLGSLGVPDCKMGTLILRRPVLVSTKPGRMKTLVERVEGLGIYPGSGMFVVALSSVCNLRKSTFDAKSKLLMSFGWTQAELISTIQRFPIILQYSEKKIHAVMDFLLNEAGCELSYIARRPSLVGHSVEKRLKPRFYILQSLKMKGLPSRRMDLCSAMLIKEDNFIQKYIIPYSDKVPGLLEAYRAICAKNAEANTDSI